MYLTRYYVLSQVSLPLAFQPFIKPFSYTLLPPLRFVLVLGDEFHSDGVKHRDTEILGG